MIRLVFDIEANGLLYPANVMWCIVIKNIDTGEIRRYTYDNILAGIKHLASADILIGHNICGYDLPLIKKLTGIQLDVSKCRDTLVMSKLFFPEKRLHNLEIYGDKFGRCKPGHEDWTRFSGDMLHRCTEDVEINHILYDWLVKKEIKKWDWGKSIILEQYFSYDQAMQELAGVDVDVDSARDTLRRLDEEIGEISKKLDEELPLRIVNKKPVNRPFKKDGDYSSMVYDYFPCDDKTILTVEAPFSRISYEKINLNSHDQVKKYLLSVGWVPTTWNYKKDENGFFAKDAKGDKIKTSPKLTEDSFPTIKGGLGQLIARRSILNHRRNNISNIEDPENKGILSFIRDDGRVPAEGLVCSTPTARTRHTGAICNIPKAKKKIPYGIEMRQMFGVSDPDYVMLGADLDQIEARITAHFAARFDGGAYWDIIESTGDIHQYNADMLGVDRDPTAKAFQYAVFYGARAPKVREIIGGSLKRAQDCLDRFWDGTQGVYKLIQALEQYYDDHGFIKGLDGRKIIIRAKYKLLNSLIQNTAAIVFKKWGVLANMKLRSKGLDCKQILAVHDEYGYRCLKTQADEASAIIKQAAIDAGISFKLHTPITVDVQVGRNWAEVH